jgi:membrane protease YdiL (CAAX protease family)
MCRVSTRTAVLLVLGTLVVANLLYHRLLPGQGVWIGLILTGWLLLLARLAGVSAADLGLAREDVPRGLLWGFAAVGVVVVGYVLALAIPPIRDSLQESTHLALPQLTREALVVLPLSTVIPEELAFRGLLWALVRREHGTRTATVFSSACFGLWHVLPALGGGVANDAANDVVGTGAAGTALRVLGTVLFTGAAGVLFCELRRRSGSLLAPMLLHWGVNGVGDLAVRVA